jgi:hypothetical protein
LAAKKRHGTPYKEAYAAINLSRSKFFEFARELGISLKTSAPNIWARNLLCRVLFLQYTLEKTHSRMEKGGRIQWKRSRVNRKWA